jgi:hypothetical protein|tara:strand:+ start:1395 stop:1556 length:162 start_codon:yes stop_codon:yes gene_type:complete
MKVGDLVYYINDHEKLDWLAIVLYVNEEGGSIKTYVSTGNIEWYVKSDFEVVP